MTFVRAIYIMIVRAKKEGAAMPPIAKGTKLTSNPRNVRLEIRLTQAENEALEDCAVKMNATKTDVIKKGIELVKNSLKK